MVKPSVSVVERWMAADLRRSIRPGRGRRTPTPAVPPTNSRRQLGISGPAWRGNIDRMGNGPGPLASPIPPFDAHVLAKAEDASPNQRTLILREVENGAVRPRIQPQPKGAQDASEGHTHRDRMITHPTVETRLRLRPNPHGIKIHPPIFDG